MGFSLKRALAGAVVGGAHAAGEVFDAQLKEAALERERQQQFERQKELQTHQADLLMDRENRRDELKAARADKEQEKIGKNMSEIRAAVRAKGLDPDKIEGLRYAAGLADEKGYTSIADKYRQRLETERSHAANEENKKLQIAAIAESRAARKRGEADADHEKDLRRLTTYASRFDVPGFDEDNHKIVDKRGSNAAFNYGHDEIVNKGRKPSAVFAELAELASRVDSLRNLPEHAKAAPDVLFKTAVNPNWNKTTTAPVQGDDTQQTTPVKPKVEQGGGLSGWLQRQGLPPLFTDEHI